MGDLDVKLDVDKKIAHINETHDIDDGRFCVDRRFDGRRRLYTLRLHTSTTNKQIKTRYPFIVFLSFSFRCRIKKQFSQSRVTNTAAFHHHGTPHTLQMLQRLQ